MAIADIQKRTETEQSIFIGFLQIFKTSYSTVRAVYIRKAMDIRRANGEIVRIKRKNRKRNRQSIFIASPIFSKLPTALSGLWALGELRERKLRKT